MLDRRSTDLEVVPIEVEPCPSSPSGSLLERRLLSKVRNCLSQHPTLADSVARFPQRGSKNDIFRNSDAASVSRENVDRLGSQERASHRVGVSKRGPHRLGFAYVLQIHL